MEQTFSYKVLKSRVLLCFLSSDVRSHSVTGISKTLSLPKYTVTRALASLEKSGFVNREDPRAPKLTAKGTDLALRLEERVDITTKHLMFEGVGALNARHDALYWAVYSSDESMRAVRNTQEIYNAKNLLSDKKQFDGEIFSRSLGSGEHAFPFVLYYAAKNGECSLSPLGSCFEPLCSFSVNAKESALCLRTRTAEIVRIRELYYFQNGDFIRAEKNGNVFSIPARAVNFINTGGKNNPAFHTGVRLNVEYFKKAEVAVRRVLFAAMI